MDIKFKYLNLYYILATLISPICVYILILEPDIGEYSNKLQTLCLVIILGIGVSGALLAVLEKTKTIYISYAEEDKKKPFYKVIQVIENSKIK
ncbi:MAG: hypothetical protein GY799_28190 [Desulfobulbaceae bacterium]|nr:hypothetical protein [Desulfobulbaceae bacterium]